MSEVYLITGFLGAGKTSFLRNFIKLFPGRKIRLIINEFGKESVDGLLLKDMGALMQEIYGGSVFCACRLDQFEAALRQVQEDETVIVEASGLSDPSGVRKLLGSTERFPNLSYKGAICLADALRFHKCYDTVRACLKQVAASDVALINKCDLASPEQIQKVRDILSNHRPDMPVFETSFGALPENLLEILQKSQNGDKDAEQMSVMDISLKKMALKMPDNMKASQIEHFIRLFAEYTFRVKGFIKTADRGVLLCDCVADVLSLKETEIDVEPQRLGVLNILSGNKMPMRSKVKFACEFYSDYNFEILKD